MILKKKYLKPTMTVLEIDSPSLLESSNPTMNVQTAPSWGESEEQEDQPFTFE